MGVLDRFLNAMKRNDNDGFDDDDFLDDEMDDFEEEAPKKRFFKKQNEEDDLGDLDMDEKVPSGKEKSKAKSFQKSGSTSSPRPYSTSSAKTSNSGKISQMRTTKKSVAGMEVCVIKPRSMEDTREITDTLLANCTVVLNMEGLDVDIAQRIIDFSSGSCYAIDGNLKNICEALNLSADHLLDLKPLDTDAYDYTIFHVLMEQCPNSYRDGLYRVMSAYVQSVSEALKKEGS